MPDPILFTNPSNIKLEPEPISRDWVRDGSPTGSSRILSKSRDGLTTLVVWECTAGIFEWRYTRDETLVVLSGEASIVESQGRARRFGPGDVVFFPAGSRCTWIVEDRIRKVAILKEPLWQPLGLFLALCNRMWRKVWWQVVKLRAKIRGPLSQDEECIRSTAVRPGNRDI
jgi:uncharacterized cupin superfamily protein